MHLQVTHLCTYKVQLLTLGQQEAFFCVFSDPSECGVSVTKPRARNVRGNKATSGVWPWQIHVFWDGKPGRAVPKPLFKTG